MTNSQNSEKEKDRGANDKWPAGGTRLLFRLGGVAGLLSILLVYGAAVWWSPLNQDEGWYLLAARNVSEGQRPYRDFAFSQGPVFPHVYAHCAPLIRRWGIIGGRAVTAGFGLAALALAARLAARLAGGSRTRQCTAALIAAWLCGWNVYHVMFTTVVKTYALCAFFWTAALLALVSIRHSRVPWLYATGAGFLLALAAATRASAAMAFPVALAWLWVDREAAPGRSRWAFAGALALGTALVWLPSALVAPEGLRFAVLTYHSGRSTGGFLQGIAYRAGSVSRWVRAGLPALMLLIPPLLVRQRRSAAPGAFPAGSGWIGAMVLLVWLVHLAAPFPYEDYQVFLFPVLSSLAACGFTRWAEPRLGRAGDRCNAGVGPVRLLRVGVAGLLLLHGFGSPIWQEWAIAGRDRIWWHLRSESEVAVLRKTAARLRTEFPESACILTQDLYLAIETGWSVPAGLELGPFSYFPDMPDAEAERLRVLNRAAMERLLRTSDAPVAAFSGYGLAIASPGITELEKSERDRLRSLLEHRYEHLFTIPSFGQAGTPLAVFRLRSESAEAAEAEP